MTTATANQTTTKVQLTKYGFAQDYRGAHVTIEWQGRQLLGEVTDMFAHPVTGNRHFRVRHFNGEMWPIEPGSLMVDVLIRDQSA